MVVDLVLDSRATTPGAEEPQPPPPPPPPPPPTEEEAARAAYLRAVDELLARRPLDLGVAFTVDDKARTDPVTATPPAGLVGSLVHMKFAGRPNLAKYIENNASLFSSQTLPLRALLTLMEGGTNRRKHELVVCGVEERNPEMVIVTLAGADAFGAVAAPLLAEGRTLDDACEAARSQAEPRYRLVYKTSKRMVSLQMDAVKALMEALRFHVQGPCRIKQPPKARPPPAAAAAVQVARRPPKTSWYSHHLRTFMERVVPPPAEIGAFMPMFRCLLDWGKAPTGMTRAHPMRPILRAVAERREDEIRRDVAGPQMEDLSSFVVKAVKIAEPDTDPVNASRCVQLLQRCGMWMLPCCDAFLKKHEACDLLVGGYLEAWRSSVGPTHQPSAQEVRETFLHLTGAPARAADIPADASDGEVMDLICMIADHLLHGGRMSTAASFLAVATDGFFRYLITGDTFALFQVMAEGPASDAALAAIVGAMFANRGFKAAPQVRDFAVANRARIVVASRTGPQVEDEAGPVEAPAEPSEGGGAVKLHRLQEAMGMGRSSRPRHQPARLNPSGRGRAAASTGGQERDPLAQADREDAASTSESEGGSGDEFDAADA